MNGESRAAVAFELFERESGRRYSRSRILNPYRVTPSWV